MHYIKMLAFFGEVNVITSNGHSLWLFSALSSCIHTLHSELQPSPAGAIPRLHPSASRCCLQCLAAHPSLLLWLAPWPCHLLGLANDAAKIVSPPLLNDMISLLSFIVGKIKTWKGRSLSSQPWH